MSKTTLRDSRFIRWSILIVVSATMAVNYFFYDVLSPLQGKLREMLNFTIRSMVFLYRPIQSRMYSWLWLWLEELSSIKSVSGSPVPCSSD
jgi:hypothetical protein